MLIILVLFSSQFAFYLYEKLKWRKSWRKIRQKKIEKISQKTSQILNWAYFYGVKYAILDFFEM